MSPCDLVASVSAETLESLFRRATRASEGVDAIELRLDGLAPAQRDATAVAQTAASVAERTGRPLVLACHGPEAYGSFGGDVHERTRLLRAAARPGDWIDVHRDLASAFGEPPVGVRRVVSEHVLADDPALDPSARIASLLSLCGPDDRAKFVPHAHRGEQALELLRALDGQSDPRVVAFAAGERGQCTRLLAPILGSAAVYAAAPGAAGTAPGQLRAADLRAAWPVAGISDRTGIVGLLGRGIGHSRSPAVHTAVFRARAMDAVFVNFDVDHFEPAMGALDALERVVGLAITAPFKLDAGRFCRTGLVGESVNTLLRNEGSSTGGPGGWHGASTDSGAAMDLIRRMAGEAEADLLVLGGGGAARVVLRYRQHRNRTRSSSGQSVDEVATRRPEVAEALAEQYGCAPRSWSALDATRATTVVQCTPIGGPGLEHDSPPFENHWPASRALIEANYGAGATPLVRRARAAGARVADGRDWFLGQAEGQVEGFEAVLARHRGGAEAWRDLDSPAALRDLIGEAFDGAFDGAGEGAE